MSLLDLTIADALRVVCWAMLPLAATMCLMGAGETTDGPGKSLSGALGMALIVAFGVAAYMAGVKA